MEMSDTVDRYLKSRADLANPDIGQPPHPLDENRHRYALDRVQIDRTRIRDRIRTRLQDHLTGQPANVRRARGDERAPQPWDGGIAREDDDRPPANIGDLGPPELTPTRQRVHDAPAARRHEARSPHSSGSSGGCASYAAYPASISADRLRASRARRASSTMAASVPPTRNFRAAVSRSVSTVVLNRVRTMPRSCHCADSRAMNRTIHPPPRRITPLSPTAMEPVLVLTRAPPLFPR